MVQDSCASSSDATHSRQTPLQICFESRQIYLVPVIAIGKTSPSNFYSNIFLSTNIYKYIVMIWNIYTNVKVHF